MKIWSTDRIYENKCVVKTMLSEDTDGDTVLCVTDPDIISLRRKARKTLLVDIGSKTKEVEISPRTLKENMVISLKDNGIGIITNYATTWRDIQLHVVNARKITDKKMRWALNCCKNAANASLKLRETWVSEDESIKAIANMDLDNWKSVYKACNSALCTLRELQERAINTAKSGIFVEFGGTDRSKNGYTHLVIGARAKWHRPNAKVWFESESTLSTISKYVDEQWQELKEWAMETSISLFPGAKANYGTKYKDIFEIVNALRIEYGKSSYNLVKKKNIIGEDAFNEELSKLIENMHTALKLLSIEHGTDIVVVAAYDASNTESTKTSSGKSFVWNCFFEEMMDTIKYLNQEKTGKRLYSVLLDPRFNYETCNAKEIYVKDGKVFEETEQIGLCKIEDGNYNTVIVKNRIYIEKETEKDTLSELNSSLAGTELTIIGLSKNPDLVSGNKLSRASALEHIRKANNIVWTKFYTFKNKQNKEQVYVGFSVRYAPKKYMLLGVIPYVDRVMGRCLKNKLLKIEPVDTNSKSDSRLTVKVTNIIKDLDK